MNDFLKILKDKILVLDGGLGTMIQQYNFDENDFRGREFLCHPQPLRGFNDILNITKPTAIKEIHKTYLKAGANIITTNTFNSNLISMKDYGLDEIRALSSRLNKEGALIAREAVEEFKKEYGEGDFFVAGSIGPTNRSLSMSPDISNPFERNLSFQSLYEAYCLQSEGLLKGGVDLLLCETCFDTLNLKAALDAANFTMKKFSIELPIIVSATVSDNSGRMLAGQTLEAFVTSICGYDNVAVIGVNCGFGPNRMKIFLEEINKINPRFTSCHPNAGLPDESGCYNVSPEDYASTMDKILKDRELNIVGGCCGTTPEHIRALASAAEDKLPRVPEVKSEILRLSGLDMLSVKDSFLTVGERCNVAGSAKFLRLIKEKNWEEAAEIAKAQVRNGAAVLDINMDDALLDAKKEMVDFLRYILAEPEVAKVPFMIDSSKWEVIESALKEIQGKGIVNSLSLKEGEDIFIQRARRVKELGFALVVMAFDEKGQADTYQRKIEVCERAYNILTNRCGYKPEDIIFDVNVMTIGTGMREHARYAMDFIDAVAWIKENLPGARTSGGVSNLSFAFRGKNKIRENMHVIFLHHASMRGLDMAIVNPNQKTKYSEIPLEERKIIEDLLFDRDEEAIEKLIQIANTSDTAEKNKKKIDIQADTKEKSIEEILEQDLMEGRLIGLEEHLQLALDKIKNPISIIEGPLLSGMKKVGDLFGEGKMFLPQVVKTARTMKKAVEILTPHIYSGAENNSKSGKILIATVKGDVHDIGKNIVATVLGCNNYEIIDLGIMVAPECIVESAIKESPDIICLSGLITPSLGEMAETVRQLDEAGIRIPVMVGGAATSKQHTALKIAPLYKGPVIHMLDASQNPIAAGKLNNPSLKDEFLKEISDEQLSIVNKAAKSEDIVSFKKVREIVKEEKRNEMVVCDVPSVEIGKPIIIPLTLDQVVPLINWRMFFSAWKIQGKHLDSFPYSDQPEDIATWINSLAEEEKPKAREAINLYQTALEIILWMDKNHNFEGKGIIRIEEATGDVEGIKIAEQTFPMLRQQRKGTDFLSCADFVGSSSASYIGLFTVTAGRNLHELSKKLERENDTYKSLVAQTLADRIAEASAEYLNRLCDEKYFKVNIRPAWGYPMLPDQTMILETQDFLPYQDIGVSLTENGAMYPPASISGLFISDKKAKYFMVGEIGQDQITDYARRRGMSVEKAKDLLRQI